MISTTFTGHLRYALLLLCATLLWLGSSSGARADVTINVGDNWQTVVNANPAGTRYIIAAGTHRLQSVRPHNGDTFSGEYGAIMSGAKILTGWISGGSGRYYVTGQTQQNWTNDSEGGSIEIGYAAECHPEDLFVDGVRWQHVNTLAECNAANEWFFDYAADRIYVYGNPAGHTVETSVTRTALTGLDASNNPVVSNVTVENLVIKNYANSSRPTCAIHAGAGWTIRYCEITQNHAGGVFIGSGGTLTNCLISYNGQIGARGGGASATTIQNNEICYNRQLHYKAGWEGGGTKFGGSNTLIQNNWSHHNWGPGIWCDVNCVDHIIRSNLVEENEGHAGIFYEISYGADIYWNIVRNHDLWGTTGDTNMGIYISSSSDCEVYENWTYNNRHEIFARNADRGSGSLGLYEVRNLKVHDNDMTLVSGSPGLRITYGDITVYNSQKGNEYYDNTYRLDNPTTAEKWYWKTTGDSSMTQAQWKNAWSYGGDAGNDINGTFLTRANPGSLPQGATAFSVSDYGPQPPGTPPSAPSSLSATAVSTSQINLSWTDNADDETGFKIERKTGAGGVWGQIDTVGANVTSYQNTNLSASTQYYYRVRAYNAYGNSSYSNEANATTDDEGGGGGEGGMLLELLFDEGSGTPADTSGNDSTISTSGTISWTADGYSGDAIDFSSGGKVNATSGPIITDLDGDFTMEARVKLATAPNWKNGIFSKEVYQTSGFRCGIDSSRHLTFWTGQDGGNFTVTSTAQIPLNTYTHVKVTCVSGTITLYINGSPSGSGTGTFVRNTTSNFVVGGFAGSEAFQGKIDEVKVYLPATAELQLLFDEGSGTPADTSGQGNTITASGTLGWTVDGYSDDAIDFTSGCKVNASGSITTALSGDFTMEAYVKLATAPNWKNGIFSKETYQTSGFRCGIDSSRHLTFWTGQDGGNFTVTSTAQIPLNTYTHVKVTCVSGTITLYVNGSPSGSGTGTFVRNTTSNFVVGGFAGSEAFKGKIDEVKVTVP